MSARGRPDQVEELLAHATWVKRIAADLVDSDQADDVAQDVWVTSIRRPPADRSSLRAWLRTVVTNLVRSGYRSDRRREARETAVSLTAADPASDSPEELTSRMQLQRRLVEQILALREPYRQAVFLRYVEDLSAAQIARRLKVPPGTVRRRVKVGLDHLRERLGEQPDDRRRMRMLAPVLPLGLVPSSADRPIARPPLATGVWVLGAGLLVSLCLIIIAAIRWGPPPAARAVPSGPPAAAPRAPVFTPVFEEPDPAQIQMFEDTRAADGSEIAEAEVALTGRVLDTGGAGVAGATINSFTWRFDGDGESPREVRADEQGRYQMMVPPGRYILRARSAGYGSATTWLELRGGRVVDLRLHRTARLMGRVVDPGGRPLPGGEVTISSWQSRTRTAGVDASGAFSLSVQPGSYRVSARRGALFGMAGPIRARPAETVETVVSLAPAAAVHGRVSTESPGGSLSGLGGAIVSALPRDDRGACKGFQATTRTAPDGDYRLEGLPACEIDLQVTAPRHVRRSVPAGAASTDRRLDVRLVRASVLTGQVRDAADAAAGGADIYLAATPQHAPAGGRDAGQARFRQLVSDSQGRFEIDGLPAGDVSILVRQGGQVASIGPERLAAGETRHLTVKLGAAASISGRVVYPDGAPAPGFSLQAVATRAGRSLGPQAEAVTDEDGRFTIEAVNAGLVSLRPAQSWFVIPPGSTTPEVRATTLTLGAGERRTGMALIVVRPGRSVTGVVTESDGRPVPGATVDVYLEHPTRRWPDFEARVFTDDNGRFELADSVVAGTHTLGVEHPLHGRVWHTGVRSGGPPAAVRMKRREAAAHR